VKVAMRIPFLWFTDELPVISSSLRACGCSRIDHTVGAAVLSKAIFFGLDVRKKLL
jgi:hypothetical protein